LPAECIRLIRQPASSVRNIYKYYVSYKLTEETREAARETREQVAPGTEK
jgi:hypothetical protein